MRISDWSSDVCSSDLHHSEQVADQRDRTGDEGRDRPYRLFARDTGEVAERTAELAEPLHSRLPVRPDRRRRDRQRRVGVGMIEQLENDRGGEGRGDSFCAQHVEQRSEEHTSELQSLMRISYAVFGLKKKRKDILTPT